MHRKAQEAPTFAWCGRFRFEAERVRGHGVDVIEIVLRMDVAEVLVNGRCVGVTDRDLLRLWLSRPVNPFEFDEVELTCLADLIVMATLTNRRFVLPSSVALSLRSRA